MRVVLHGGFHKTGTTSLQAALAAHAPALEGRVRVMTLRKDPALALATEAARTFSRQGDRGALEQAMTTWAQSLPDTGGADLAISTEDFAGHMPGRYGLTDYRAAVVTLPAAVAALAARYVAADITVLMTTRAAEPWLKSLHWQLSIHPELTPKQRRFCKDFASAAQFDAVLTPLRAALGAAARLVVTPLESLMGRPLGPVEAVYDLVTLPDDLRASLPALPRSNARVAEGLADQFVMLNRAKLPTAELRRAKSAMQGLMLDLERDD